MKKILLVLAMMLLLSSVALAEDNVSNRFGFGAFIPPPLPPLEHRYIWKVYVESSFPFGMLEKNFKTRTTLKVIPTDEIELGQGFVTVVMFGKQKSKLLIPNDRVLYIIQTDWFIGWDTYGGTE